MTTILGVMRNNVYSNPEEYIYLNISTYRTETIMSSFEHHPVTVSPY